MYAPYDTDKTTIPNKMDKNLSKYDVGDEIMGTISYKVVKKDSKEITLCVEKFACKPQVRYKAEEDEY